MAAAILVIFRLFDARIVGTASLIPRTWAPAPFAPAPFLPHSLIINAKKREAVGK
jgi:hypothetical protein